MLLLHALGITGCVLAWGYLVYAAIDFGSTARSGDPAAWGFLGLASLGAVACLFAGLMLVAHLLRRLGVTSGPPPQERVEDLSPVVPEPLEGTPRPVGGRRAAR